MVTVQGMATIICMMTNDHLRDYSHPWDCLNDYDHSMEGDLPRDGDRLKKGDIYWDGDHS